MQIIDRSGEKISVGIKLFFFAILNIVTFGKVEGIDEKYRSAKKEFKEEMYKI